MAVAPTGNIFKALSFDNVSSRTYGVYITGEAVYNAPEREVEMISIPGRNGQFALDKGRFENIEVTYPAGIFAQNETDFANAISDFRNFLCSREGYVRLTDEYNPNEYRMAIYKSGLEVEPAMLRAGEFEITFDCKPQRFLTSGETASTVSSGGTLANPTLFESSPLIEAEGYGTIGFNGYEIKINQNVIGNIQLKEKLQSTSLTGYYTFDTSLLATGDSITISGYPYSSPPACSVQTSVDFVLAKNAGVSITTHSGTNTVYTQLMQTGDAQGTSYVSAIYKLSPITFTMGTSGTFTATMQGSFSTQKGSQNGQGAITSSTTVTYNGNNRIDIAVTRSITTDTIGVLSLRTSGDYFIVCTTTGNSSISTLGHPTYIDCDLGEAYKFESDAYVSLNRYIDLGSKLPTLASGSNTITYSNTITSLKIAPRWWKV